MLTLRVDGKDVQVAVDREHRLPVHKSIPTNTSPSPPSSNVFGLAPYIVHTEKGRGYRVQDGATINCCPLTCYPHEGPQFENVYHLLDLSKSPIPSSWRWRDRFGLYPAVLLTVQVHEAEEVSDGYPNKEKFPKDRIATLDSLKTALQKVGVEQNSEWTSALLIRFHFENKPISHDDHNLGHLSLDAALYIRNVLKSRLIAVQAPSLDRADCPDCDVHRVLFGLQVGQVVLETEPTTFIAGENFYFDETLPDGKYLFECSGVDWLDQDVTISTSACYKV